MYPNEQLAQPLGSWILADPVDWLEYWEWFATLDGQFLYFREGPSVWHHFLRRPNSHHSYFGEPSIAWVTAYMRSSPSIQPLLDDIANGKAVAVGDGSYFEIYGVGSSAWILSSTDGSSWIEGGGIVPGPIKDLNSYRCELGALLGLGVGTACLKNLLPDTKHFMITACDNLEAMRKSTVDRTKVKITWKSVDLI